MSVRVIGGISVPLGLRHHFDDAYRVVVWLSAIVSPRARCGYQ